MSSSITYNLLIIKNNRNFIGPAVGSFLYEIGGFVLPFEIMGGLCLLAAFGVFFSIPDFPEDNSNGGGDSLTSKSNDLKKRMGLTSVLKV